jgi:methionyl-tRNA synthetase
LQCEEFLQEMYENFLEYVKIMEQVKLKDGLKKAMHLSNVLNQFMQKTEPWVLIKTNKKQYCMFLNILSRCGNVMNLLANGLIVLCGIIEPFLPSFSAKVYAIMNYKERDYNIIEYLFNSSSKNILELIKAGHEIDHPLPIIREGFQKINSKNNDY